MIIDFHTHIFPRYFRHERNRFFTDEPAFELLYSSPKSKIIGSKDIFRNMEEEGVDISIVFGFPWKNPDHYRRHNDYVLESIERAPDRLIGFCCFDPLTKQAPREAERCLKGGMSGIGELAVYDSDFSEDTILALKDIMAIGRDYDVPLLLHVNEPVGHKYPGKIPMGLSQIYSLLKKYSQNKIVLAHWGGGLFFYGLMKKEVKDALSHVYFDTAASPYLYDAEVYGLAGNIIGFEKILLGSDYPLLKPGKYLKEMESAGLGKNAIGKIAGENAALLLNLPK